eukprot:gene28067-31170_t
MANAAALPSSSPKTRKNFLPTLKANASSISQLAASDAVVTQKVFFDMEIDGGEQIGRIVMGVFGNDVPKTASNFVGLATMKRNGLDTGVVTFPKVMFKVRDFQYGNGTGGYSIDKRKFEDENYRIRHEPYVLSMMKMSKRCQDLEPPLLVDLHSTRRVDCQATPGRRSNGSQFFITTAPSPWLDGRHVFHNRPSTPYVTPGSMARYRHLVFFCPLLPPDASPFLRSRHSFPSPPPAFHSLLPCFFLALPPSSSTDITASTLHPHSTPFIWH